MNEKDTSFFLKGERQYVHGTSIYDDLLNTAACQVFDSIDITFKHPILNTACSWFFADSEQKLEAVSESAPCFGRLTVATKETYFVLRPKAESATAESITYDEEKICQSCELSKEGGQQNIQQGYSFIENLVALTKRFHNTFYPLNHGKWLFARLQVGAIPASTEKVAIKLESMIPQRLSKMQVQVNEQTVGHIYFSAG